MITELIKKDLSNIEEGTRIVDYYGMQTKTDTWKRKVEHIYKKGNTTKIIVERPSEINGLKSYTIYTKTDFCAFFKKIIQG